MPVKAIIFDLDGTLVDTLADIAAAGNHMLAAMGLPTLPVSDFRMLVGHGAMWMVRQTLGDARRDDWDRAFSIFRSYYDQHAMDFSTLYPGIAELLDALTHRGIALAILSNKPDPAVQLVHGHLLKDWPFQMVQGQREGVPLKPDPTSARHMAASLGAEPAEVIYVGDMTIDIQTAKAAGFVDVGVSWGIGEVEPMKQLGASHLIDHPRELLTLLDTP